MSDSILAPYPPPLPLPSSAASSALQQQREPEVSAALRERANATKDFLDNKYASLSLERLEQGSLSYLGVSTIHCC